MIGKGLLIGLIAGATIGSVLALLYAPKSGRKLRKDIKIKSQDFIEDTDKYVSDAKDKASQLIKDTKGKIEDLLDQSGNELYDAKNRASNHAHNAKDKIEKGSGRFKSAIKAGVTAYKIEKET